MDVIIEPSSSKLQVTSHRQYDAPDSLSPSTVLADPIAQFKEWFTQAKSTPDNLVPEPEAMSLSTVSSQGVPSSRFVLLKQVDQTGFVFYTNYTSRKSREIEETPWAALAFYWSGMHRQVRVVGRVEKVTREESWAYFNGRPLGSRLGAWASPQSSVVGEDELKNRLMSVEERFGCAQDKELAVEHPVQTTEVNVPLPDFWGGWRVVPT